MSKLFSITECARQHGVARSTIHAAIDRGALVAERVGHGWVITEEACLAFAPEQDPKERGRRGAAARWSRSSRPANSSVDGNSGDPNSD